MSNNNNLPMYYSKIRIDPVNDQIVYTLGQIDTVKGVRLQVDGERRLLEEPIGLDKKTDLAVLKVEGGPLIERMVSDAGSTPASNGCAFSSLWQKPWIVEIQAASSSRARSARSSSSSRARIRLRSSPAARSV